MNTLFDVGDTIEFTVRGKVREYMKTYDGDCYTIVLSDQNDLRIYVDTESLIVSNAKKVG